MSLNFRPVYEGEIAQFCRLVDAAYSRQVRYLFGDTRSGRWNHYPEAKVRAYRDREPAGVRIGHQGKRIITVNVCRSYGSLGWMHTLGVDPHFQGKGYGSQALVDGIDYLRQRGVDTYALMTWPTAIDNIGFYGRRGFRPTGLSLHGYRRVQIPLLTGDSTLSVYPYSSIRPKDLPQEMQEVAELCHRILPGLDYSPWLRWTHDHGIGDSLFMRCEGQLVALALMYAWDFSDSLEGKLLLIAPELSLSLQGWVLEHLRQWTASLGKTSFSFPFDIMDDSSITLLRQYDFRLISDSMLNLVRGELWPPRGVHAVRFSG